MENFRTTFDIASPPRKIRYPGKVLAVGSCFAENLSLKLAYYKFHQLLNPTGIVFNPFSCAEALEYCLGLKTWERSTLQQRGELWVSLSHHGSFSQFEKEEVIKAIHASLENGKAFASQMDTLVITWGTAWVYRWKESGEVVANCHKLPAHLFSKELLSIEAITEKYEGLISQVLRTNPDCQIILTLSPVRHWKDGATQNQESKATLRLAIRELQNRFPQLYYFPSYELLMDDLRDYRFYSSDMLHPNEAAVSYVWERFKAACIHPNCHEVMDQIQKIQQALLHEPRHPKGEDFKNHIKRIQNWIETLESREVWLNFEAERNWLNSR